MLSHGHGQRALRRHEGRPGLGGARATLAPTLPYLVPLAAAVAASAAGVESMPTLAAVAGSAVACALVRLVVEHARIALVRERADAWIVSHTGQPPTDEILVARIDELLRPRLRADLARSFQRIAADSVSCGRALAPAQHNRQALRCHIEELSRLAERLGDPSQPVTPRGVALACRLVTWGGGPLYNSHRAEELPASLNHALAALDLDGR